MTRPARHFREDGTKARSALNVRKTARRVSEANNPEKKANPVTDHLDIWSSVYVKKATTGRGSNGKISAYGIQKLRELILELAVRGKLAPQDPNDEPASVLLVKIAKEKARLIKEKEVRKTKKPAPYGEPPEHDLPHSWSWTTLYELGEIGPRNDLDDQLETAFVPMRCISEKYGNLVQYELRQWKEIKTGFTHFQENDVALAKITPCFQNGKSAVMHGLKNGVGAGTTELHVFRSINDTVVPEYVLIYLKSPGFILEGIHRMTGTAGQKRITRDYFAGKPFPFPPLAEQLRIVAKVDELMAICDQLEQQHTDSITAHQTLVETLLGALTTASDQKDFEQTWQRIAEHFDTLFTTEHSIDQLKQTILQLAVMGKLVPQDPNDEPASRLLEKIAEEKARLVKEGKIRKRKPLPGITEEEMLFGLPMGWKWCRLQDLVYLLGDGLHGTPEYTPDERYYFVNGHNLKDGEIVIKPETKTVDREQYEKHKKELGKNTVLVSINGTLGNVAFYNSEEIVLGKSACYFNLAEDIYKRFIKIVIESPGFHSFAFKNATGSTIKNLGLKAMNSLPIALPTKEQQHHIVTKVDELMALCDTLKASIQDAQTTRVQLADAIVEQAVA